MISKGLIMSKFTVVIDTDNSAFDECAGAELSRILTDVAYRVDLISHRQRVKSQSIFDFNGNRVGQWKWEA